jgi:NAD(P)-dependent dehydrogenase (short-subunit alcohol dehydrogenase family)
MAVKHLDGKVAIVTGGAGGMGSQISKVFAEQGARVLVADTGADVEGRMGVDPARVNAVVDDIKKAGGEAIGAIGDIADMDTAEGVVRQALDTWGQLDILVCAHGILRERMIFNMTEDEWDGVVRTHLKGCFAPTKFASIWWRAQRTHGGRIIYFTSDAGVSGGAGQPNYSAAHAGKLGLMRSNARALAAYGVTCNVIAPLASTRMTDRGRAVDSSQPPPSASAAGTALDPKNVVPIIVWLASNEGGIANGRIFGASGHRISVYNEPIQERVLWSAEPMFDIDRLFEEWPRTLGLGGYPMNRMQGMAPEPQPGAAAS